MRVIWKFELALDITGHCSVQMPRSRSPLTVGAQYSRLVMWAAVDPSSGVENVEFAVVGTGQELPAGAYRGTAQMPNGLVWHVIEIRSGTAKEETR